MDFFKDIIAANTPDGTIKGICLGIVAATDDPLGMQRLKVYDQTKGGRFKTDWLFRLLPYTQFNPPVPKINDLVVVGFIDGDPHKGCYLGVVVNQKNKPVGSNDDLTVILGSTKITLNSTGDISIDGAKTLSVTNSDTVTIKSTTKVELETPSLSVKSASVEFKDCSSFKVGGKQIVTVGATDTGGDTINNKGW